MTSFALLLVGTAIAYALATRLKIPAPPLLVAVGILTNLSGAFPDKEMVGFVLLLGVTVLVFVAGAELNPARFARQGLAALKVGVAQFVSLGAVGFGIAHLLGFDLIGSAYAGLALAASSTFVVVRILKERRQLYEPFGRMVLGVLLIQDVLVILGLAALIQWDSGLQAVESAVFRSLVLLLVAYIAARTMVPWLLTKLKLDEEAQLIVVLAILFVFTGAAHKLDIPLITGAFCAGFAVSPFPVNAVIRGQLTSLSDFFIALFFTALGAMLVVPNPQTLLIAFAMVVSVLVMTPLLVTFFAERSGMTARAAIESGLLLAQTSEFSLLVVLLGTEEKHLSPELLSAIALTTVATMMLTPFIARDSMVWRVLRLHPSSFRRELDERDLAGHVVVLGVGQNAERLVRELVERGRQVVVVDHDPVVCSWAEKAGATAIRADASDPRMLRTIRAHHALAVVSTLKDVGDNCRIISTLGSVTTIVRAFEAEDVARIEAAGGVAIPYSDAATEDFFEWFDKELSAAS